HPPFSPRKKNREHSNAVHGRLRHWLHPAVVLTHPASNLVPRLAAVRQGFNAPVLGYSIFVRNKKTAQCHKACTVGYAIGSTLLARIGAWRPPQCRDYAAVRQGFNAPV